MATAENGEKVVLQQGCTHVNSEQGPSEGNTHERNSSESLVLEGQKEKKRIQRVRACQASQNSGTSNQEFCKINFVNFSSHLTYNTAATKLIVLSSCALLS